MIPEATSSTLYSAASTTSSRSDVHSSSSQNEGDRPEKADMGMPVRLVNTPATRCARNPFSRPVVYVDGRTVQRVARGKLWGWAGRQTRRVSRCGGVQMRKRGRRLLCCCARAISKRSQGTNITQRAEIYLGRMERSAMGIYRPFWFTT